MLFVTEPNRLKVLAGKILALTTSIAAAIAIRKRLINHAPAEEHLFGAPVEDPPTAPRSLLGSRGHLWRTAHSVA